MKQQAIIPFARALSGSISAASNHVTGPIPSEKQSMYTERRQTTATAVAGLSPEGSTRNAQARVKIVAVTPSADATTMGRRPMRST